jgi:hypothetical protein
MAAPWPWKSPATEHPTHRSPSKSLALTENSSWPAVTHTASRRVDSPSAWAFTHGSYKKQLKNPETTEYVEIDGRGHSLILDHGWPDVADPALTFIKRFL